jgi:hypothetical protein
MYVYIYTFIHAIICILTEGILDISHIRPTMSSTDDINIASLVYLSSQTAAAHVHHTAKSMCKALSRALRAPLCSYGCRIHRGNTATGVAYTAATQRRVSHTPRQHSDGCRIHRDNTATGVAYTATTQRRVSHTPRQHSDGCRIHRGNTAAY